LGSTSIRVLEPGLLTTVQDRGRPDAEPLGIPAGGALDFYAHTWANILAGNQADAAVLEATLAGPALAVSEDCWIATTGAAEVSVEGRPCPSWAGFWVRAEAVIRLGKTERTRSYFGIHGGIDVQLVLGSRSTDLASGFGGYEGRALRPDDVLAVGECLPLTYPRSAMLQHPFPPAGSDPVVVRVVLGPHDDAFSREAMSTMLGSSYIVSPRSNRMGLRLEGPVVPTSARASRISEAMPMGGIQIPPDGQPIVLLNDRGTLGGYPVLATVITSDIWRLGQARPGDIIRFQAVSVDAAQAIVRQRLAELAGMGPVLRAFSLRST
jgi:antagonist of KipI